MSESRYGLRGPWTIQHSCPVYDTQQDRFVTFADVLAALNATEAGLLERVEAALRAHWLAGVQCDHDRKLDRASCACSVINLGWHESVGAAVESWIQHALSDLRAARGVK